MLVIISISNSADESIDKANSVLSDSLLANCKTEVAFDKTLRGLEVTNRDVTFGNKTATCEAVTTSTEAKNGENKIYYIRLIFF